MLLSISSQRMIKSTLYCLAYVLKIPFQHDAYATHELMDVKCYYVKGFRFLVPRHNTVPDPDALHNPCPQHNSCWVTPW